MTSDFTARQCKERINIINEVLNENATNEVEKSYILHYGNVTKLNEILDKEIEREEKNVNGNS